MTLRGTAWLGMTLLALAVSGYTGALLLAAPFRPSFAQALFTQMPWSTVWHLACGAIALTVGALQLNSRLRVSFLDLHRWLGRVYVLAVVVGGITGLALALRASGGSAAQLGFGLLAVCWVTSTLNAFRHIRRGNVMAHRDWMMRSYALTFAAVTLRIYLPAAELAGAKFEAAYPVIAWLCWVPNVLVVEWFVQLRRRDGAVSPA